MIARDQSGQDEYPLLNIENLTITDGSQIIVDDVSLAVNAGEILGLVGESGCGKSVTALSILKLLPQPLQVRTGRINYCERDIFSLPDRRLRNVRGGEIAMIFQEPTTSLNPVFKVGSQIAEVLYLHRKIPRRNRRLTLRKQVRELLARVGIASPEQTLDRYPHQLSGGQRQRIMIAMALACAPTVLIADEPTTALDVTVQAQILELISELCREDDLAVLLITHDLGVVQQYCRRIAVMYCGQIVEQASCEAMFEHPRHRYTQALLHTIPAANPPGLALPAIPGNVPEPGNFPSACRFTPRCTAVISRCHQEAPVLSISDHPVRCWNPAL